MFISRYVLLCIAVRSVYTFPVTDFEEDFDDELPVDITHESLVDGVKEDVAQHLIENAKGERGGGFYEDSEKGVSGEHFSKDQKGFYDKNGGHKTGHTNSAGYYKNEDGIVKAANGEDFAVSSGFRKGSKTTGFHNVHHKEEYKKDKKFYDESHKSGSYKAYGDFGAVLLKAKGAEEKGKKFDDGFKNYSYGQLGHGRTASLYDKLKEYGRGEGFEAYHDNIRKVLKEGQQKDYVKY